MTHKCFLADHEDAGVGLEVDAAGALHDLEAGDGNVLFGGEPEADEVEDHLGGMLRGLLGGMTVGQEGKLKKILVAALRRRV
jgi:hypothetical protein